MRQSTRQSELHSPFMANTGLAALLGLAGVLVAVFLTTPVLAQPQDPGAGPGVTKGKEKPASLPSAQLSRASDQELTALAASWGKLNPSQRRALLAEMRTRMAHNQNQARLFRRDQAGPAPRQYGRVIREVRKTRQPDGSILVETRVVRVRPKPDSQGPTTASSTSASSASAKEQPVPGHRVTFGFGFERRQQQPEPAVPVDSNSHSEAPSNQ